MFDMPSLSVDERRKRVFLSLCIFVTAPATTIFGLIDFFQQRHAEGALIIGISLLLISVLCLFRYLEKMVSAYRFCSGIVFLVLVYEMATGGGEGYAFVWFYFFPIALFFLFGNREGFFWVTASLGAIVVFLFIHPLGAYIYGIGVSVRYFLTYFIVSVISYALELSRDHYYQALLKEKKALEEAMQKVKRLSGLLPLCSHCKKIRNDQGYWQRIEAYIGEHSDASVSHGICPDCAAKYYQDFDIYDE